MSNIFNINRFNKVLGYDLKNIIHNYGPAMIIMMLMPFIAVFFYVFIQLFSSEELEFPSSVARWIIFFITGVAMYMSYGSTTYGYLTDKRAGPDYILLPASTTEKFTSMFIISALIVPVVFMAGYLFIDWLTVKFGLADGAAILSSSLDEIIKEEDVSFNFWPLVFFSFSTNALVYLLGAIFFNRRKIVLTILSVLAIQFIFSIFLLIMSNSGIEFDNDWLEHFVLKNSDYINIILNAIIYSFLVLEYIVLGVLIYLRVKTIKH